MGQEVRRKKGETFESLLRRFSKRLQQSGKLIEARKTRFRETGKSKPERRKDAIKRNEFNAKREYLRKVGRLKDDQFKRRKY